MQTIFQLVATTFLGVIFVQSDLDAADKPMRPQPGKAQPESTPLSLTIEGTVKYSLDAKAKSEDELKKGFATDLFPSPPKVDLKLVIKNTGDKAVSIWTSGDPVTIDLELNGKGVVKVAPQMMMTQEFRIPKSAEIAAGKSVELPLKALAGGKRGISQFVYWTAAGQYELIATLNTAVSPAPKGSVAADDGFGKVQVVSEVLKLTVETKR